MANEGLQARAGEENFWGTVWMTYTLIELKTARLSSDRHLVLATRTRAFSTRAGATIVGTQSMKVVASAKPCPIPTDAISRRVAVTRAHKRCKSNSKNGPLPLCEVSKPATRPLGFCLSSIQFISRSYEKTFGGRFGLLTPSAICPGVAGPGLIEKMEPASVNRTRTGLRAALELAATLDQTVSRWLFHNTRVVRAPPPKPLDVLQVEGARKSTCDAVSRAP